MKQFLLIAKNWFKSIAKMKLAFSIFLVLNIMFAISFTIFLEINKQLKQRVEIPQYQNNDVLTFRRVRNIFKQPGTNKLFYELFCSDYVEIKERVVPTFDPKKERVPNVIKRFPILTFGDADSCFQVIDWNNLEFDYFLQSDAIGRARVVFTKVQFRNRHNILKLNPTSPFYQRSLHYQLKNKYEQTKNHNYLEILRQIESTFFPKIVKGIEKQLLKRANNLKGIYPTTRKQKINLQQLRVILDEKRNIPAKFIYRSEDKKLKDYWTKLVLSPIQERTIQNLINELDLTKNPDLIENNKTKSKKILEQFLTIIEIWRTNKWWQPIAIVDAEYDNFKKEIEDSIENGAINREEKLSDLVQNYRLEHWEKWLKTQKAQFNDRSAVKIPNWLLANINFITKQLTRKFSTPRINQLTKIQAYSKQIATITNSQIKKTEFVVGDKKQSLSTWRTQLLQGVLSDNHALDLIGQISQQLDSIDQYIQIQQFANTPESARKWEAITEETNEEGAKSQLQQIFKQKQGIKKLNAQEIKQLHQVIRELVKKIVTKRNQQINIINHALKINGEYKQNLSPWQIWKQNPIRIDDRWKTTTLENIAKNQDKDGTKVQFVDIVRFADDENDQQKVRIESNNLGIMQLTIRGKKGWNTDQKTLLTFLDEIKTIAPLNIDSNIETITNWQKIHLLLKQVISKMTDYFISYSKKTGDSASPKYLYSFLQKAIVKRLTSRIQSLGFNLSEEEAIKDWESTKTLLTKQRRFRQLFNLLELKNLYETSKLFENRDRLLFYFDEYIKLSATLAMSEANLAWLRSNAFIQLDQIKSGFSTNFPQIEPWLRYWNQQMLKQLWKSKKDYVLNLQEADISKEIDQKTDQTIEDILNWNKAWIEQEKKELFYFFIESKLSNQQDIDKLQLSENIIQLVQKLRTNQKKIQKFKEDLDKKINPLVEQGLNIEGYQLDFPFQEINDITPMIVGQTRAKSYPKKWNIPFKWNKNIYHWLIKEIKGDTEEKLPWQLFDKPTVINQNWSQNWFNALQPVSTLNNWTTVAFIRDLELNDFYLLLKTKLKLYDLDLSVLQFTNINDIKNNKNYLMVQPNDQLAINIIEGRKPFLDNEIMISPIFAKNWNVKVGDKINLLGLKNIQIVGIGIQKEFIYQAISWFNFIPRDNEGIFYTSKKAYRSIFWTKFKAVPGNNYYSESRVIAITKPNSNISNPKTQVDTWNNLFAEEKSFTEHSLRINGEEKDFEAQERIVDNYLIYPKILKLEENFLFPFVLTKQMLDLNNNILFYLAIAMAVICLVIISLITFYITQHTINNGRKTIGVLKSLGIKTHQFLWGMIPLTSLIFLAIFLGWIGGVFLQIPIFNAIERFFNFRFDRYNFNFGYLFINFGIVITFAFLTVIIFYFWQLRKITIEELMKEKKQNESRLSLWLKNLLINKTNLNKYLFVKINYIFFATIWKKIVITIVVFIALTIIITGNILVFTISKQTTFEQYKDLNHNYEITYWDVIKNNPLSRKRVLLNPGYSKIVKNKKDTLAPLNKEGFNFFVQEEGKDKQELLQLKTIREILWFMLPIHWKAFNLSWLKQILKQNKSGERQMCQIISAITKSKNILSRGENCINSQIGNYIPFKIDDPIKAANQVPFALNGINFDPTKDELFSNALVHVNGNEEKTTFIYGLKEDTKAFNFKPQTKKDVFANPQKNLQLTEIKNIKAVVNKRFLEEYKMQIGDKFQITTMPVYNQFMTQRGEWQTPTRNDWKYEDVYNHLDNCNWICTLDKLDSDVRFYNSEELNKSLNFNISNNEIRYKNKKVKLLYQKHNGEYKPMIDITKISLELDKNRIYPFVETKTETENFLGKKISWFARQIRNGTIKTVRELNAETMKHLTIEIVDTIKEINKSRIFINQEYLNILLGWPTTKDPSNNQYLWFNGRFSKSEQIYDFLYNISLSNEYGYNDADTLHVNPNKNFFIRQSIRLPSIQKKLIKDFTNYIVELTIVFIVNQAIMVILFFIFIVFDIARSIRENGLKLKMFGYSTWFVLSMLVQMIFIPAIIGFVVGSFIIRIFLQYFLQYISKIVKFELFFDAGVVWPIIVLSFIVLVLVFLLLRNKKAIDKPDFSKIFRNV